MNVVGKVGSLITQGVYSVATPFHPFGGAVDVIVVQQQDGSFRSTPWYVRFGKFQGVLKSAEKIVHINVNGVEANFHMYLDNSGEAYFVREVNYDNKIESVLTDTNNAGAAQMVDSEDGINDDGRFVETCRLKHSISDSAVVQLQVERDSSAAIRMERQDTRFYEFEDEQTFLEGSPEFSGYGSNQYEKMESEVVESKGSDSEVVLMSVDGHVLTAPISTTDHDTEDVQLSTPQFHLGPGRGTEFCEDDGEFSTDKNAWADDYFSELNASTANVASIGTWNPDNNDNAYLHQLEVSEGVEEHDCKLPDDQPQEILSIENEEQSVTGSDSEDVSNMIRRKDGIRSCLELQELPKNVESSDVRNESPSEKGPNSQEESSMDGQTVGERQHENDMQLTKTNDLSISQDFSSLNGNMYPDLLAAAHEVNQNILEAAVVGVDNMQEVHASEDDNKNKLTDISDEGNADHPSSSLELSLCGNKLKAGIGSVAAAEAFEAHQVSEEVFRSSAASIIKNPNLIVKYIEKYFLWDKAAPLVLGIASFGLDLPIEPKDAILVEQDERPMPQDKDSGTSSSSGRIWRLWPIPFRRVKTSEHTSGNSSNEEVSVDSEPEVQNRPLESNVLSVANRASPHKQYIRTNVPTNEQVASLNLKEGQNLVTFSFSTRVLGTQEVDAHIYLWKWNAKIVISDVDGTITKSDVLGQFMPLVGKDWTQSGVATLFSAIKENGYQLLFLSARAIAQAYLTRSFLLNLKQDGKTLPSGPVVISPDGLFPSLFREVIRRVPHEFKIACLEDIRNLFPPDYNPFYAGFGNRDTDELSYRKIGIPKGKIFIINPKGEVAVSQRTDRGKSYTSLHTLVNDMFPPTLSVEHEEYNSWNYWKMPLPDIDESASH